MCFLAVNKWVIGLLIMIEHFSFLLRKVTYTSIYFCVYYFVDHQVVCGSNHSCILTKNGEVYTWGRNTDGQLGNGSRTDHVRFNF